MSKINSIKRLVKRYALAEIMGTITAVCAAGAVYQGTGSLAKAAVAGSMGEAIGYYAVATLRELKHYYRTHHKHPHIRRIMLTAGHSTRGLAVEFGPAYLVDSLLIRPLLLYWLPQILPWVWAAWLIGKLL